jgi:DNA polymerase epsilon subunit 2
MLTRSPEGRLCLEDLDGVVPLDISQAVIRFWNHLETPILTHSNSQGPSEGLFTEGAFVLVEGEYTDEEVLSVIAIGHPPSERRSVSR